MVLAIDSDLMSGSFSSTILFVVGPSESMMIKSTVTEASLFSAEKEHAFDNQTTMSSNSLKFGQRLHLSWGEYPCSEVSNSYHRQARTLRTCSAEALFLVDTEGVCGGTCKRATPASKTT